MSHSDAQEALARVAEGFRAWIIPSPVKTVWSCSRCEEVPRSRPLLAITPGLRNSGAPVETVAVAVSGARCDFDEIGADGAFETVGGWSCRTSFRHAARWGLRSGALAWARICRRSRGLMEDVTGRTARGAAGGGPANVPQLGRRLALSRRVCASSASGLSSSVSMHHAAGEELSRTGSARRTLTSQRVDGHRRSDFLSDAPLRSLAASDTDSGAQLAEFRDLSCSVPRRERPAGSTAGTAATARRNIEIGLTEW